MPVEMKPNLAAAPLELRPTCPAATPLGGPPVLGPSVICNAIRLEKARKDPTQERRDQRGEAVLYGRSDRGYGGDPESIVALCCGDYGSCPIWRAEKKRVWERTDELVGDDRPEEPPEAESIEELVELALERDEHGPTVDPSVCPCGADVVVTDGGLRCRTGRPGHRGIPAVAA